MQEGQVDSRFRGNDEEDAVRKEPRWVVSFLRALERTGVARTAAEDAGVDHTTAYARRRAHGEFAVRWEAVLAERKARVKREEAEEIAAVLAQPSHPSPGSPSASPPSPPEGRGACAEELVASGGQMKRAGHDRWSKRKERLFFEELAATCNIRRAAKAAGVSPNAVHARRLKHPVFAAQWEAVAKSAKAAINMHLLEETRKSFDPDQLETGDVKPTVSVAEAIRIVQAHGSRAEVGAVQSCQEQADAMGAQELEELRERVLRKVQRASMQIRRERLEAGWTLDESYDREVPPGYVKGPDYREKPADE